MTTKPSDMKPAQPRRSEYSSMLEYVQAFRRWCYVSPMTDAAGCGDYGVLALVAYLDEQHAAGQGEASVFSDANKTRAWDSALASLVAKGVDVDDLLKRGAEAIARYGAPVPAGQGESDDGSSWRQCPGCGATYPIASVCSNCPAPVAAPPAQPVTLPVHQRTAEQLAAKYPGEPAQPVAAGPAQWTRQFSRGADANECALCGKTFLEHRRVEGGGINSNYCPVLPVAAEPAPYTAECVECGTRFRDSDGRQFPEWQHEECGGLVRKIPKPSAVAAEPAVPVAGEDEPFCFEELRGHIGHRRGDKRYCLTLDGIQVDRLLALHDAARCHTEILQQSGDECARRRDAALAQVEQLKAQRVRLQGELGASQERVAELDARVGAFVRVVGDTEEVSIREALELFVDLRQRGNSGWLPKIDLPDEAADVLARRVAYYLPKPLPGQAILERAQDSLAELHKRAEALTAANERAARLEERNAFLEEIVIAERKERLGCTDEEARDLGTYLRNENAKEQEPPPVATGERPIVVGSTWRAKDTGRSFQIDSFDIDYERVGFVDAENGTRFVSYRGTFCKLHEWISDPPTPATGGEGEA